MYSVWQISSIGRLLIVTCLEIAIRLEKHASCK